MIDHLMFVLLFTHRCLRKCGFLHVHYSHVGAVGLLFIRRANEGLVGGAGAHRLVDSTSNLSEWLSVMILTTFSLYRTHAASRKCDARVLTIRLVNAADTRDSS